MRIMLMSASNGKHSKTCRSLQNNWRYKNCFTRYAELTGTLMCNCNFCRQVVSAPFRFIFFYILQLGDTSLALPNWTEAKEGAHCIMSPTGVFSCPRINVGVLFLLLNAAVAFAAPIHLSAPSGSDAVPPKAHINDVGVPVTPNTVHAVASAPKNTNSTEALSSLKVPLMSPASGALASPSSSPLSEKPTDVMWAEFLTFLSMRLPAVFGRDAASHSSATNRATMDPGQSISAKGVQDVGRKERANLMLTPLSLKKFSSRGGSDKLVYSGAAISPTSVHVGAVNLSASRQLSAGELVTSFVERISSGLQAFGGSVFNLFPQRSRKRTFRIKSRNDTMFVGHLHDSAWTTGSLKLVRAVQHEGMLSFEVEQDPPSEVAADDVLSMRKRGAASVLGSEYEIHIGNSSIDLDNLRLIPLTGPNSYEVIIPLKVAEQIVPLSESPIPTPVKASAKFPMADDKQLESSLGSRREADEYEFLQAQMGCQSRHGVHGVTRMLCTCEEFHGSNTRHKLRCVSRIADKAVHVAHLHGHDELAKELFLSAANCRRPKMSMSSNYICLVRAVQLWSGKRSHLHIHHSRSILSDGKDHNAAADANFGIKEEVVLKKQLADKDGIVPVHNGWGGEKEEVGRQVMSGQASEKSTLKRVLVFLAYVGGALLLTVGAIDLLKQYRLHRVYSKRADDFARLPEQVCALYSRFMPFR